VLPVTIGSVGFRLHQQRMARGLLQRDVAKMVGVSKAVIGHYERNRLIPSLPVLTLLSKLFGCSVEYIISGSVDKSREARNLSEMKALELFRRTPSEMHDAMLMVMRDVSKLAAGSTKRARPPARAG
jgi:transcriptional regulator with XRE-family HTH domain